MSTSEKSIKVRVRKDKKDRKVQKVQKRSVESVKSVESVESVKNVKSVKSDKSDKSNKSNTSKLSKKTDISSLQKQNTDLKEKLRRMLTEAENKIAEYRSKLEHAQSYFQAEINKEKNKLRTSLGTNEHIVQQNTEANQKFENTIITLQDRLNRLTEEKKVFQVTAEEVSREREDKLQIRIHDMEQTLNTENKKVDILARTLANERLVAKTQHEFREAQFKKDKDEEFRKLFLEKDTTISSLQGESENMKIRVKNLEQKCNNIVTSAKFEMDKQKLEYEQKITALNLFLTRKEDESQKKLDGQLFELERVNNQKLHEQEVQFKKTIDNLNSEHIRHLDSEADNKQKEIACLLQTIHKQEKELNREIPKQDECYIQQLVEEKQKLAVQLIAQMETKQKELENERLRYEKIVGEMQENNHYLKNENEQLKGNFRKVQENTQSVNNQFINTLNEQKKIADQEIYDRDVKIQKLETQLRVIAEESIDRFNSLERKQKITDEELTSMTDRYNKLRGYGDTTEQQLEKYRTENQKYKEIATNIVTKMKYLQLEKESLEKKVVTMSDESRIKESEYIQARGEALKLMQIETRYRGEISDLTISISKMKAEIERLEKK